MRHDLLGRAARGLAHYLAARRIVALVKCDRHAPARLTVYCRTPTDLGSVPRRFAGYTVRATFRSQATAEDHA